MKTNKGPIQILCDEAGVKFHESMETTENVKAFVSVLVDEVSEIMRIQKSLSDCTSIGAPSEKAYEILEWVKKLLTMPTADLLQACEKRYSIIPWQEEGPCDHNIDMLDSCVSGLQFGLGEQKFRSRHMASSAAHIFKKKYGLALFDSTSNRWEKEWMALKFYEALAKNAAELETLRTAQKES